MKVKRAFVVAKYGADVEAMYGAAAGLVSYSTQSFGSLGAL